MTNAVSTAKPRVVKKRPTQAAAVPARPTKNPLKLGNCKNGHGDNVLFYTDKNGYKTWCIDCKKQHNDNYYVINGSSILEKNKSRAHLPKTSVCQKHPGCDWWNAAGNGCGYCSAESHFVSHAKDRDAKKGLECTMTLDYVRQYIGSNCAICGYGPLQPYKEANHPRQLSMDRIDNSKPHDCDPFQTQAVCYQCNTGKSIHSVDQFFVFLSGIVNSIPTDVSPDVISMLNDDSWMSQKLYMKERDRRTDRDGNPKKAEDIVPFTLTNEQAFAQLEAQRYCCSLCNLALSVDDCSFDQTDAKNGYVAGMFTFMHYCCNAFKGQWSIDVAIETAHRAVAYRQSKTV
jgi:hypothetical protein